MDIMFIIAQILGILAWIFMLVSYYKKNTTKIIYVQIAGTICYLLNYVFLGAIAGSFIIVFELVRDYLYYKKPYKSNLIFLLSIPFYIILAIMTKNVYIELIPILASLIEGFSFTKKRTVVVPVAVFVYAMWIFYDIEVLSITGAITDVIIVLSNIVVIIKYLTKAKKISESRVYSHKIINDNIFLSINKLSKEYYGNKLTFSKEYQKKLYDRNNDSFSLIKYKNKLIGYINYLNISEKEYKEIIYNEDLVIDYDDKDILEYSNDKPNYILIDAIVIDEDYISTKAVDLYNKIIDKYVKRIFKEYNVENVISVGVTDFEKQVLLKSKLKDKKKMKNGNILYMYKGE